MRDKTGGAAFPTPRFMVDDESRFVGFSINTDGMSLRDYFAAKAMQALIDNDVFFSEIPTQAYEIADAMLEERSK